MEYQRLIWIILDGVGLGSQPDASLYGDQGADTLGNIARKLGGITLPNLEKLGLGKAHDIPGVSPRVRAEGAYGKLQEMSPGKDSTTGHWELAGVILEKPFPTYPEGFPKEVVEEFENRIGRKVIGNKTASGTEIIKELGELHLKTGSPILYTSVDSVFQIAAHKEVIPLHELYRICEVARGILQGEHNVCRVIARPFVGSPGSFTRVNEERRDFALPPPRPTLLDCAIKEGLAVLGAGKVADLFAGRGFIQCPHTGDNYDTMMKLQEMVEGGDRGMVIVNLVDFDMVYGHRNNVEGFYQALREFDDYLTRLKESLKEGDICFITSDHGCDPTFPGTDHTREYALFLAMGKGIKADEDIGIRSSFADCASTAADLLGLKCGLDGSSFATMIT